MKTNQEVAEAWSRGQSAEGSNLFTDGITIWSYGYHFPIAKKVNGRILFNPTYYSSSTSKHQCHVMRAIHDSRRLVFCRDIKSHITNEEKVKGAVKERMAKIPNCRKEEDRVNDVLSELFNFEEYLEVMGLKKPKWARDIRFALENLHGKTLRVWAKNYRF